MIAIIDYGVGNLFSLRSSFAAIGQDAVVTSDIEEIRRADRLILPGVGAFGDAMGKLERFGLVDVLREAAASGKPFLGICLGLQLLFESSEESPGAEGLCILRGKILRIPKGEGRKVPQIGWNDLTFPNPGRLFRGLDEGIYVYFVHSYYLRAEDPSIVTATTQYGVRIDAAVEKGNVFACQFHPEKSESVGMKMLENFLNI